MPVPSVVFAFASSNLFSQGKGAIFPCVAEEQVGVAARDAEVMAVKREGCAIECAILACSNRIGGRPKYR